MILVLRWKVQALRYILECKLFSIKPRSSNANILYLSGGQEGQKSVMQATGQPLPPSIQVNFREKPIRFLAK